MQKEMFQGGVCFTWGAGHSGELGHTKIDKEGECPLPTMVPGLEGVIQAACGDGFTACITKEGHLYTWGSGRGGKTGHGDQEKRISPTRVERPFFEQKMRVLFVALGESHAACIADENHRWIFTWGVEGHRGVLGRPTTGENSTPATIPGRVSICWGRKQKNKNEGEEKKEEGGAGGAAAASASFPRRLSRPATPPNGFVEENFEGAMEVSCGFGSTGVILADGRLFTWGDGSFGKLGHGDERDQRFPRQVVGGEKNQSNEEVEDISFPQRVRAVSMGSLYSACICTETGRVFMWGFGGAGNLGRNNRNNSSIPLPVLNLPCRAKTVHCTIGQISPVTTGQMEGIENPHTMVVGEGEGELYCFGTNHKGILGNLKKKGLNFAGGDELLPYRVGGVCRDAVEEGESGYLKGVRVVEAVSSSIHSAVLSDAGHVFCFGCGSTGRMGVMKYLEGLGGKKSRMKCYIPCPTPIVLDARYFVSNISSSRRHMCAVAHVRKRNDQIEEEGGGKSD